MEFALATVTVLSLVMTLSMGAVTWRLVREERLIVAGAAQKTAAGASVGDDVNDRGAHVARGLLRLLVHRL